MSRLYLAPVLLVSQSELRIGVTEAVGVHGTKVTTFDQRDADDASPQLVLTVQLCQTHGLLLQRQNPEGQRKRDGERERKKESLLHRFYILNHFWCLKQEHQHHVDPGAKIWERMTTTTNSSTAPSQCITCTSC